MSSFYVNEPNATAKVLIHTTAGDLEIELWAKETPLTSRNFLQLCLDGYYNNTIFHRLVPGFVLQGGDPTGTGHGGEAIYQGGLFADEFHPRLKFSRRGLLGMANSGKKDDNGSQFFFTLSGDASVKELTGKNTLFGKVVGDSIYNLVKMGEMELEEEGSERMLYPVKITGTEVLINPFEDMVAREAEREKRKREQEEKERTAAAGAKKAVPKKRIAVGKKGKALLSFGEDLEEGEGDDVVLPVKKMKFDTRLVTDVPDATNSTSKPSVPEKSEKGKSLIKDKKPSSPSASRKSSPSPPPFSTTTKPTSKTPIPIPSRSPSSSPPPPSNDFLAKTNAQIAELKAALKRGADTALQLPPTSTTKKSLLDIQKDMLPITSIKGRKRKRNKAAGADADEFDDAAMDALERFKQKLQSATFAANAASLRSRSVDDGDSDRDETPDTEEARDDSLANPENGDAEKKDAKAGAEIDEDEEVQLCDLHFIPNCLSCQSWDKEKSNGKGAGASGARENDDIIRPEDLLGHTLRFGKDRFGKDLNWKKEHEYDDGLVVIDPREKGREILSEGGRGRGGRGGGTGRGGGGSWRGGGGGARGGGFGRGGGGGSGRRH